MRFAWRYLVRWLQHRDHHAAVYLARLDCRRRMRGSRP